MRTGFAQWKMARWVLFPFLLALCPVSGAQLNEAQVTQIVEDVQLLSGQAARPATLHDSVRENTAVRTGTESRTELTFSDQTLTRLGANTLFSFNEGTRRLDLGGGAMLVSVPQGAPSAMVRTAAVTAAISGGTSLLEHHKHAYAKLICMEGLLRVWLTRHPNKSLSLHPGQMLIVKVDAESLPEPFEIDLEKLVRTCLLITDFPPLTNEPLIAEAIRYQQQQKAQGTLVATEVIYHEDGTVVTLFDPTSFDLISLVAIGPVGPAPPIFSIITYLGAPGGNWSAPASWTPAIVPNNAGGLTYTAVINGGMIFQDIVTGVVIQQLQMSGGTLQLDNPLTLNTGLLFSGGTITGGNVFIAGASTQSATMTLQNVTLNNSGTYGITLGSGNAFSASGSNFINSGTLGKTDAGFEEVFFSLPINNSGTISALSGALTFNGGGTNSGIFSPSGNAVINFASNFSMLSGTRFSGPGVVSFASGTSTTFAGTITNTGTLSFNSGGTFTDFVLNGNVTLTGGGVVNLSAADRILGNGTLTTNNTIQGETSGGGSLGADQIGIVNQTGGIIDANGTGLALDVDPNAANGMVNQGTMRASNGGILLLNGNNGGAFNNAGGAISVLNGSEVRLINNASVTGGTVTSALGSTIRLTSGSSLNLGAGTLSNAGMLIAEDNTTTTLSGAISNAGSISLNSTGSFTDLVLAGSLSIDDEGTINLANAARILGSGTLTNMANIILGETTGGSLGFDQIGIINQAAGAIIANVSGLTLNVDPSASGGLINQGLMRATNGGILLLSGNGGGAFNNSGTIDATSGGILNFNGIVNSSGLVDVGGSALSVTGSYTQTAGTFRLTGGTVTSASALNFQGGTVDARGTITGAINSAAMLRPALGGAGLTVNGNVTLMTASALSFQLGGLTQGSRYSFLNVNGTVALSGTLVLSFANGFENSVTGSDTFTIASASGGLAGIFSNIASGGRLAAGGLGSFQVDYVGNDIVLSNFLPPGAVVAALWTGAAGNWSDPTQWNINPNFPNNGQPSPGDLYDATLNNGGTITLDIPITIENFTLSSGTVTGANTLTINQVFTFDGGTLAGAGIFNANGGINMAGANQLNLNGATLNNAVGQTATDSGVHDFGVSGGAVINNAGIWLAQGDLGLNFGTGGIFNNSGTFTRNVGAGTYQVQSALVFNNTGAVNVNSGTLNLQGGGTSTGSFVANAGGVLNFGGGTHNLNAGTSVTGAGTVQVGGATWNMNAGTYNVTGTTQVSGGSANFAVNASTNLLNVTGGTLATTASFTSSGLFDWGGGTLAGAGIFNANGGINMAGGSQLNLNGATLNNAVGQTATDSGFHDFGVSGSAVINNAGTWLAQNDLGFDLGSGGTFNNSGTFTRNTGAGTYQVHNALVFNNTGAVDVNSGTLNLQGGGTSTGSFVANAGGVLNFGGGTHNLNAGTSVTGAGTVQIGGGTWNLNAGTYNVTGTTMVNGGTANFAVNAGTNLLNVGGGTLATAATATFTTSGLFDWSGGTLAGAGIFNANGGINMAGGSQLNLNGATLNNAVGQTATDSGFHDFGVSGSAVINNAGTWLAQNDLGFDLGSGGTFNNSGTFTRNTGAGTYQVHNALVFNNSGTVNAETGTLAFTGGYTQTAGTLNVLDTVFSTTALAIQGGLVTGIGTINAAINSNGTIMPALGGNGLTVNGNVTLMSASSLSFQLGGLTQGNLYSFLNVNGSVGLSGNLVLSFANGFEGTVTGADTFTITIASGGLTGVFANIASGARLDTSDGFGSFQVDYTGNNIVLSNFLPPVAPVMEAVWTGGSGNWSDPANWNIDPNFPNNGQPNPGDLYNATVTNSGTITLDIPITIENFTLARGTVTGANVLTFNHVFTWSSGALAGGVTATQTAGSSSIVHGVGVAGSGSTLNNAAGQTATLSGSGHSRLYQRRRSSITTACSLPKTIFPSSTRRRGRHHSTTAASSPATRARARFLDQRGHRLQQHRHGERCRLGRWALPAGMAETRQVISMSRPARRLISTATLLSPPPRTWPAPARSFLAAACNR